MTPSEREAARQRRELIIRERRTQRELIVAYGQAIKELKTEIDEAKRLVVEAQSMGVSGTRWLTREHRLESTLEGLRIGLARYLTQITPHVVGLQSDQARQAIEDSYRLIQASLGDNRVGAIEFRPPDPSVVARLIGNAADGTPLGDLLREAAGPAVNEARQTILVGVARGQHPSVIARKLRQVAKITAVRALAISRTESLRAYRQVTSNTLQQNPGVVTGWYWQSACDMRTCPACWGMTGSFHPVDESLNSHVNCRCSMVPATKTWAELGFEGIPSPDGPQVAPGEDTFAALTRPEQRQILGPGKYDAFTAGASLRDMAHDTHSPRWGKGIRTARVRDLVA